MHFNFDLVVNSFPLLLVGAGVTIKITALSVALGVVIGLFVGIARISRLLLRTAGHHGAARRSVRRSHRFLRH